ncbi:hypothetical protein [Kitasatospora nipponensis]
MTASGRMVEQVDGSSEWIATNLADPVFAAVQPYEDEQVHPTTAGSGPR